MEIIKTTKLTKSYGKARGIIDLELTVEQGEFFGFIGPNGAGKSTTIRTLLGLIAPTSGKAMVFGQDVTRDKQAILQRTGYLPSEALFYQGMRVKDVLKLSAELRKQDCSAEANRLCERLELDVSRKVDELSFGNRKKVGIVCALQHNPELLILDEATSALDSVTEAKIQASFDRLCEGRTSIIIAHRLSTIRNADRIAVIGQARVMEQGTHEELMEKNGEYAGLVRAQEQVMGQSNH